MRGKFLALILALTLPALALAQNVGPVQWSAITNFAGTSTFSANAYTVATPNPTTWALTDRNKIRFLAGGTNTGAATLNVSATGATSIKKQVATGFANLSGGEIVAGLEFEATYNATCACYALTNGALSPVASNFLTGTVTQSQWANSAVIVVSTAGQTITLPAASSLAPNGGLFIQTSGVTTTLAPNAADGINGGTVGASVSLPSGGTYLITTTGSSGATAFTQTGTGGTAGTVSNCGTADALAYYSSTGTTITCLSSAGTTGQVLTSAGPGSAPTFQAPGVSGGGAWSLVSTQTASTSSSLQWTGLTQDDYQLVCRGITTSNASATMYIQLGSSTGPTWDVTTNYVFSARGNSNGSNPNTGGYYAFTNGFSSAAGDIGFHTAVTGSGNFSGELHGLSRAGTAKGYHAFSNSVGTGPTYYYFQIDGSTTNGDTLAETAIRVAPFVSAAINGTFNGVCSLYVLSQ